MKLKKIAAIAFTAAAMFALTNPCYAKWTVTDEGNAYWNDDTTGALVKNAWIHDYDGNWVCIDKDGWVVMNMWVYGNDGCWYYVDEDGVMLKTGYWNVPYQYAYYSLPAGDYKYQSFDGGTYHIAANGKVDTE